MTPGEAAVMNASVGFADDTADGAAHTRVEGGLLRDRACVQRLQQQREVVGPGQASGVGGQDTVGASLHGVMPPSLSSTALEPRHHLVGEVLDDTVLTIQRRIEHDL